MHKHIELTIWYMCFLVCADYYKQFQVALNEYAANEKAYF